MRCSLSLALGLFLLAPAVHGGDYVQRAKLIGASTAAGDQLGISIDTDGKHTVVGARQSPATGPGKVHVFRGCLAFVEVQELAPSDGVPGDEFGTSVAVEGDRIVVGATQPGSGTGAVYVYLFDGVQWVEEQKLVPDDGAVGDYFGYRVDLEGGLIAVGSVFHGSKAGAVYLYRFDGALWQLEQKLVFSFVGLPFQFGSALSLDGERLAVGAQRGGSGVEQTGAAAVYRNTGSQWITESVLIPSDVEAGDNTGGSIALDGKHLIVGAPSDDASRGSAVAYAFDGTDWQEQGRLVPANAAAGDEVTGWFVDVDGDTAVMAARYHDSAAVDAGAIFVYQHDGAQWVEIQEITAADAAEGDSLYSVALHGGFLVAGALRKDDAGEDSGAAYAFRDPKHRYGVGLAGAGGVVPDLEAIGNPAPAGTVTLQYRGFVGGAHGCSLLSLGHDDTPLLGGTLLVDLLQPFSAVGFVTPGEAGEVASGDVDVALTLPFTANFSCINLYAQGIALDPAAPGGVSMTNGYRLSTDQLIPPINR